MEKRLVTRKEGFLYETRGCALSNMSFVKRAADVCLSLHLKSHQDHLKILCVCVGGGEGGQYTFLWRKKKSVNSWLLQ
jgi:hypothetical protein